VDFSELGEIIKYNIETRAMRKWDWAKNLGVEAGYRVYHLYRTCQGSATILEFLLECDRGLWYLVESCGTLWYLMESCGTLWNLVEPYRRF